MKKTTDYLENRKKTLTSERNEYATSYNKNQLVIVEMNKTIKKMKSVADEAMEIFSPKFRETNSFNKHEVKEMELKMVTLSQVNSDLIRKIRLIDKELVQIENCLVEIKQMEAVMKK